MCNFIHVYMCVLFLFFFLGGGAGDKLQYLCDHDFNGECLWFLPMCIIILYTVNTLEVYVTMDRKHTGCIMVCRYMVCRYLYIHYRL